MKWRSLLLLGLALLLAVSLGSCISKPPVIKEFLAFPAQIIAGEEAFLTWRVRDATTITIDQGIGEVSGAGVLPISPMTTIAYTLTASNNGETVTKAVVIIVNPVSATSKIPSPTPTPVENPRYIYINGAIYVGEDGEPIELVNNPNATNSTYAELLAFIKEDSTDENRYATSAEVHIGFTKVPYSCGDFAEDVHNNAEAAGVRAAWVGIDFEGDDKGHALNAFATTDRGLVYIDCTGEGTLSRLTFRIVRTEEGFSPKKSNPTSWDKVAYVEIGNEYGVIDIAIAKSLSYGFYEEYKRKWQECEKLLTDYNEEVTQFNRECSDYEEWLSDYNDDVTQYNQEFSDYEERLSDYNELMEDGPEELEELRLQIMDGMRRIFSLRYGRPFEQEGEYLEEQRTILKGMEAKLESWEVSLREKGQEIDELAEELSDYWFEPLGIVKDIQIHWGKE